MNKNDNFSRPEREPIETVVEMLMQFLPDGREKDELLLIKTTGEIAGHLSTIARPDRSVSHDAVKERLEYLALVETGLRQYIETNGIRERDDDG